MKQIRIYYESIEQGYDYIRPIVEDACGKDTEIVFVRRQRKPQISFLALYLRF